MAAPKKYGLIIPKSKQQQVAKKPALVKKSVFGNHDSSDEEDATAVKASINRSLFQESDKKARNRAAQVTMSRALEEDPTVYQYDEVYDKMTNDRHSVAEQKKSSKDRKPKYVHQLLKNAAARKLDDERRMERQAHRDREKEGDEFGDKEAYITPSFLKKQAELKAAEEAARRKEAAEAANDVTKKEDLSDFYRNLLSRKTSSGSQWTSLPTDPEKPEQVTKTTGASTLATSTKEHKPSEPASQAVDVKMAKPTTTDDVESDPDDPIDDDAESSSAESDEVEAAMEAVKTKADREADDILARKRALDVLKRSRESLPKETPEAKLSRRNDDTSILSARERYLQRKREQAAKE